MSRAIRNVNATSPLQDRARTKQSTIYICLHSAGKGTIFGYIWCTGFAQHQTSKKAIQPDSRPEDRWRHCAIDPHDHPKHWSSRLKECKGPHGWAVRISSRLEKATKNWYGCNNGWLERCWGSPSIQDNEFPTKTGILVSWAKVTGPRKWSKDNPWSMSHLEKYG